MIIRVTQSSAGPAAQILDIDNMSALGVQVIRGLDDREVAQVLGELGVVDGDHVWLRPADLALRCEPVTAQWRVDLEAMVRYAAGRGWTDDAGRVRAHIEIYELVGDHS